MTELVSNNDIMRELGALSAETRHAEASRRVIHDKLDEAVRVQLETTKTLGEMGGELKVTTATIAQVRDVANGVAKNFHRFESDFRETHLPLIAASVEFKNEATPLLETVKIMRNIFYAILGTGVVTFGTLVALFFWARALLAQLIRLIIGL
jgi:hypothetical protein